MVTSVLTSIDSKYLPTDPLVWEASVPELDSWSPVPSPLPYKQVRKVENFDNHHWFYITYEENMNNWTYRTSFRNE